MGAGNAGESRYINTSNKSCVATPSLLYGNVHRVTASLCPGNLAIPEVGCRRRRNEQASQKTRADKRAYRAYQESESVNGILSVSHFYFPYDDYRYRTGRRFFLSEWSYRYLNYFLVLPTNTS